MTRETSRSSARKTTARRRRKKPASIRFLGVLFWVAFFIIIISLFVINREKIQQTLTGSQLYELLAGRKEGDGGTQPQPGPPEEIIIEVLPPAGASTRAAEPPEAEAPERRPPARPEDTPAVQTPPPQTAPAPVQESPAAQTTVNPERPAAPPPETPALRERSLYLIRIDSDGGVYQVRVNRRLPVSDSPMVDVLNALLAGPTREEQNGGLVSLIPGASRILPGQTTVRGTTAYISLSEEFQYNTYGVEGCAASLRQIIWTATEFSNVEDVQILIEGRRVDYLGEGIWIGSPISRLF